MGHRVTGRSGRIKKVGHALYSASMFNVCCVKSGEKHSSTKKEEVFVGQEGETRRFVHMGR